MLYKPHSLLAVQYKIQWLSYIFCSVLRGKNLKKSLKFNDLGLDIIGRERQEKIAEIKKRCFIERNQENYTFGNADESTDKELLKKVKKYVEQFEKMKEENIGLIIYGGVGTGKIYREA